MSDFVPRKRQKSTPVPYARRRDRPARHACLFAGCNSRFGFPKDLRRHQVTHKGSEDREKAICPICHSSLSRTDNLARHMSKIHQVYSGSKALPPDARRTSAGTDSAVQPSKLTGQAAPMSFWRPERGALDGCNTPLADCLVRETPAIPLPDSPVSDAHYGPGDARLAYHAPTWLPAEHKTADTLPYLQTAPPSQEENRDGDHRPYPDHSLFHPHQSCTDFESDALDSVYDYESEVDIGFESDWCPHPLGECPEEACQPAQLPRQSGSTSKGGRPTAGSSYSKGKGPASRSENGSKVSAGGSGDGGCSSDGDGDGNENNDEGSGGKQVGPRKPKKPTIRKLGKFRDPVDAFCDCVREGVICWSCCMCYGRDSISALVHHVIETYFADGYFRAPHLFHDLQNARGDLWSLPRGISHQQFKAAMNQPGTIQEKWDRMWTLLYPGIPVLDDPNRHLFNPETPRQLLKEVRKVRDEKVRLEDDNVQLRNEMFQLRNQIAAQRQTGGAADRTFPGSQHYQTPSNNGFALDSAPALTSHSYGTGQLSYHDLGSNLAEVQFDNAANAVTSQLEYDGQPIMQQWQHCSDPSSPFSQMGYGAQNLWPVQVHGAMNDQAGDGNDHDHNNFTANQFGRADDSSRFQNGLSQDSFMSYQNNSETRQDPSEQPPMQFHPSQHHNDMVPSVIDRAIGGAEDFIDPFDWIPPQAFEMQDQQGADGIWNQPSGQRAAHRTTSDTDYSLASRGLSSPSFPDHFHAFGSHENNDIPDPSHSEQNIHDLVRENGQAAGTIPWRNGQAGAHPGRNNGRGPWGST